MAESPRGVNPADAAVVLKALLDTWDVAAERMIATVARRLAQGITSDGWAEVKARQVLAIRDELLAIMARTDTSTPRLAAAALEEARRLGASRIARGTNGILIGSRPEVVQQLAEQLAGRLAATMLPVVRAHEDTFRRAVTDTELLMQTGTITRRDAVAMSVDKLLADGQDRFADQAGRRWHLDSYVRMAGRTAAGQVAVQGQLDEMTARGLDVVVVSDSPRECHLCRPWEGKLLSISGVSVGSEVDGHRVVAPVAVAFAAGLQHPNCTHRLDRHTPGLTVVDEPDQDPKGYREQQQLRAMERRMRELKRRQAAAREFGDTHTGRKLRQQQRDLSGRIAAHTDRTGQIRKRDRERPAGAR
ncbi:minor capsid protein [Amycolatopsis antarctica]|uniref:Minor capsid protein n=1 Tax=Amycolatopsis antarctica TaxID=1854586 RepID=A0A263D8W2_9PSEU|nr:phage minor capsid protein [Amycolatopsis antarctica]OZM73987.1 minor capsid protein [Amycolatopsis antarctica]